MLQVLVRAIIISLVVLNAQLPPAQTELISDIVFLPTGNTQVTIPASAIIHQRSVEGINNSHPKILLYDYFLLCRYFGTSCEFCCQ